TGLVPSIEQVQAPIRFSECRASCVCMWRQYAQPLICDTRVFTSAISLWSSPQFCRYFSTPPQGGDTVGSDGEWVESLHQVISTLASDMGISSGGSDGNGELRAGTGRATACPPLSCKRRCGALSPKHPPLGLIRATFPPTRVQCAGRRARDPGGDGPCPCISVPGPHAAAADAL